MKPHSNTPQDLGNIEVPQESMEAMARQIRVLTRASVLRRRLTVLSTAAAVALLVTVGWHLMPRHHEDVKIGSSVMARQTGQDVLSSESQDSVPVVITPERVRTGYAGIAARSVRPRRSVSDDSVAVGNISNETPEPAGEEGMPEDCPVMIYDSGKLVACGSIESVPEIDEIFNDVLGTVGGSRQVISSGVETLDETVRIIRK